MSQPRKIFPSKEPTVPEEAPDIQFNAKSLATIEERPGDQRNWFVIDPAIVYPATIHRIQQVLAANIYPEELNDPAAQPQIDPRAAGRTIFNDASRVSDEGWSNALKHRNLFSNDSVANAQILAMRAFALDVARRWFTQALHVQVGGDGAPLGLHILKSKLYKS